MIAAMVRIIATLLLAFAPLCATAQQAVPPEVARAVREVVQAQLDAFLDDDAPRAFALATPGIRETFGSAENFLAMVRSAYAVVYRPKRVVFEAPQLIEGEVMQPVRLTDGKGDRWIAVYPMQRQPDDSWRTNGCRLVRVAGTEI